MGEVFILVNDYKENVDMIKYNIGNDYDKIDSNKIDSNVYDKIDNMI